MSKKVIFAVIESKAGATAVADIPDGYSPVLNTAQRFDLAEDNDLDLFIIEVVNDLGGFQSLDNASS